MQVTRPNEIRSPGLRPALLWDSRRSLRYPSASEPQYQERRSATTYLPIWFGEETRGRTQHIINSECIFVVEVERNSRGS